jgi:hypothetical protein
MVKRSIEAIAPTGGEHFLDGSVTPTAEPVAGATNGVQSAYSPRAVRVVVRDGVDRWGSWGVVRRSAWLLVLVEAV